MTKNTESWERFLNPTSLKTNLIVGSVYLTSFEILKDSIINRLKDFFIEGIDDNGFIYNNKYKEKVLTLAKSPLKSSLVWLKNEEAINDKDIEDFNKINTFRNKLAHQMLDFIVNTPEDDFIDLLNKMIDLFSKIEKWWILNVEIPTSSEYYENEINEEEVFSGTMLTLKLLLDIAIGDENDSNKYYEHFFKNTKT